MGLIEFYKANKKMVNIAAIGLLVAGGFALIGNKKDVSTTDDNQGGDSTELNGPKKKKMKEIVIG